MIFSFFTNFPVSQRHLQAAEWCARGAGATELNHNNQVREKARKFKPIYASKILDTYSEVSIIRPGRSRLLEFEIQIDLVV